MSSYQRATELNQIRKWDQALPFAERAVAGDRLGWRNWCLLGWTLNGIGRHRDALAATEEALRLNPESEWAHRTRAVALTHLGRRTDALRAAREAVRHAAGEWRAWTRLAETAHELAYPADAREAAMRAVELAPNEASVWVTLSYICLEEDWEEAAAAALRALRLAPESPAALNNLGWARLRQGRYAEARDLFDRGIAIAPEYTKLAFNRACATTRMEGPEAGAAEFARAETLQLSIADKRLREDPADAQALAIRSSLLRRRDGDFVASLEAARQAVAADPRSAMAWGSLDWAAASLDRWNLARYAARRAVQAEPSAPSRWMEAAFTAHYAGRPDEARRWARRVVDEAPESTRAAYASALLALLDGDHAGARDLALREIKRFGENCCRRMFILNCCLELGDIAGARDALDRAEHWRPRCHCHARTRYERILTGA